MKIQLALDNLSLEKDIGLVKELRGDIDIIEIGTPLLLRYGLEIIPCIQKLMLNNLLLVDAKIVDAGELETEMILKSGVDIVTVLAGSNNRTVINALEVAKRYQKEIMIDLIDCNKKVERIKELAAFGANYFCLHRPSDISLEKELIIPERNKLPKNCKIAVAGGISLDNIEEVTKHKPEIVIIGSAITESVSPCLVLKKIKEYIKKGINN